MSMAFIKQILTEYKQKISLSLVKKYNKSKTIPYFMFKFSHCKTMVIVNYGKICMYSFSSFL